MDKGKLTIAILLMLSVFIFSCTEEVDIELDSTYTRLVVEGILTSDTTTHYIKLSKTADYFSNEVTPRVTNATVRISDGEGSVNLTEVEEGIYATPDTYFGIPGKTYTLNIELDEEINNTFEYSATETMKAPIPMDSIRVSFYPYTPFEAWTVQLYALDPPETNYYSFYVKKNNILITDTIDEISISDDRLFNGNYTPGVDVYFLVGLYESEFVNPGDTILLEMANITPEYYNFILQLQTESSGFNNPLFSGPPANVSSNINNGGMGYFAVYGISRKETVYSANQF